MKYIKQGIILLTFLIIAGVQISICFAENVEARDADCPKEEGLEDEDLFSKFHQKVLKQPKKQTQQRNEKESTPTKRKSDEKIAKKKVQPVISLSGIPKGPTKESIKIKITVKDANYKQNECEVQLREVIKEDGIRLPYTPMGKITEQQYSIEKEGIYEISAKITHKKKELAWINEKFEIDKTAPEVNLSAINESLEEQEELHVPWECCKEEHQVYVDDKVYSQQPLAVGKHHIVIKAVDDAGNETVKEKTIQTLKKQEVKKSPVQQQRKYTFTGLTTIIVAVSWYVRYRMKKGGKESYEKVG